MSPYSSNEHEYDNQHGGPNQDTRHEMANAAVSTHRPGQASSRQDARLIHCMNQRAHDVRANAEANTFRCVTPPTYFKSDSTIGFIAVIACPLHS